MKGGLLFFLLGLVFGNEVFAKCPSCPEKAIKREVESFPEPEKKEIKKREVSLSPEPEKKEITKRMQKKTIRKKPPISSAKSPFPTPYLP